MLGTGLVPPNTRAERLPRARYGLETAAGASSTCPVTADSAEPDRVTLNRRDLEALVEEAVRNDRARR